MSVKHLCVIIMLTFHDECHGSIDNKQYITFTRYPSSNNSMTSSSVYERNLRDYKEQVLFVFLRNLRGTSLFVFLFSVRTK